MAAYNENLSESLAVVGFLAANQAAGSVTVGPFATALQRRILATITSSGAGTVNAKFQASATQGGAYADVAGAAIVALAAAGSAGLEIRTETLQGLGVGPWLQLVVTVSVATTPIGVLVQGDSARYQANAPDNNIAGVATPVVL